MKLCLLLISLMVGGCCSCGSDVATYTELPPIVKINERYIPIPEILIDGASTPLVQEDDFLTFNDVFTDSATGKKIEVSGVIPTKKHKTQISSADNITVYNPDSVPKFIALSFRVPKDSVPTWDTNTTITRVPVIKPPSKVDRFFSNLINVGYVVIVIIVLLIIKERVKT